VPEHQREEFHQMVMAIVDYDIDLDVMYRKYWNSGPWGPDISVADGVLLSAYVGEPSVMN